MRVKVICNKLYIRSDNLFNFYIIIKSYFFILKAKSLKIKYLFLYSFYFQVANLVFNSIIF